MSPAQQAVIDAAVKLRNAVMERTRATYEGPEADELWRKQLDAQMALTKAVAAYEKERR